MWHWGQDPARLSPVGVAHLGTQVHLALEAWYGYDLDPAQVLNYTYGELIKERPEYEAELIKERDYALVMVDGYQEWVASEGVDAGLEVLATEHIREAQIPLYSGTSVTLIGKLDQMVRRERDGAILFRDFKTVGTLQKADSLILDTQMRTYALIQAMTCKEGERADGGLYTMLLRSKRGIRATGPFYSQVEVRYNRNDLNSMYLQVQSVATEMLAAREALDAGRDHRSVVYATPGFHCEWACAFKNVCPLMDDGSRWEDALAGNFIQRDPYDYYSDKDITAVRKAFSPRPPE